MPEEMNDAWLDFRLDAKAKERDLEIPFRRQGRAAAKGHSVQRTLVEVQADSGIFSEEPAGFRGYSCP